MLIDDYINYLNESYEIYNEASKYRWAPDISGMNSEYDFHPNVMGLDKGKLLSKTSERTGKAAFIRSVRDPESEAMIGSRYARKGRCLEVKDKLNSTLAKTKKQKKIKNISKAALGAAAVGAAAYGAKKLHDHIKAKRAKKASEVAVEEGCSLNEAYEFILECEMDLINEGYELYEIYGIVY